MKAYTAPETEIIVFEAEDVITESLICKDEMVIISGD